MTGIQETYQKFMNQGNSAAWDQQWEQAAQSYLHALDEIPDDPAALSSAGTAYYELKNFDMALIYFQKAASVSPDNPGSMEKIGRIFERNGKLTEAVQASIKAAQLFLKSGETQKSIENWQRAISMQPDHLVARTRLAMVYEHLGRIDEAVAEYLTTSSIIQQNGYPDKAMLVAEYCLKISSESEETKKIISLLNKKEQLPIPTRFHGGTAPFRMAEVRQFHSQSGDTNINMDPITEGRQNALVKLAALLFEKAVDTPIQITGDPGNRVFTSLPISDDSSNIDTTKQTMALLHLGQAIDAQTHQNDSLTAEELVKAIGDGVTHPAAFFFLGSIYFTHKNKKAQEYLHVSTKSEDYAIASYLLLGQISELELNYKEAASFYLRALAHADSVVVPQEQVEELQQLYEPIFETQNKITDDLSLIKLCETIRNQIIQPDWREQLKLSRQRLPVQYPGATPMPLAELILDNESNQVIKSLSDIQNLANQNKLYSAMEAAFFALEKAPAYLPLHILIGGILLQMGRTQEALNKFLIVSNLYELRGEPSQAIRLLNRALQVEPMDIGIRKKLIELLTNQGKILEAIHHTTTLANMHYQLAELDQSRIDYSSALRLALQSNVERAFPIQILYKIADIDMQRLDLRQALRVYEQIRTIEPEDTQARSFIVDLNFRLGQANTALGEIDGYISLLENSGKRLAGIEFLNGLITDRPDQIELRKRLANVYVRSGRVIEAVQQLDAVAESLISLGNQAEAVEILTAIIALNPTNLSQYQAALARLSRNVSG